MPAVTLPMSYGYWPEMKAEEIPVTLVDKVEEVDELDLPATDPVF